MIYAWFTLWLFLIIFAGTGVYGLLSRLTKPVIVNWLLLPGTIVSEMAYIFGCLITGGEIRRSKIMPGEGGDGGSPATDAQPKLKFLGPVVAATIATAACGLAILLSYSLLDKPVISDFLGDGKIRPVELAPKAFPGKEAVDSVRGGWNVFWDVVGHQVYILKRMAETLGQLKWKDWHVPVFLYLSVCLAVRLSNGSRPLRPTLLAGILIAGIIALIGTISTKFSDLMSADIWPLLTYVWALLLFLLVLALALTGLVALIKSIAGKGGSAAPKGA